MLQRFLRIQHLSEARDDDVHIAIVGAGATGVELSAELHHAMAELHNYRFDALNNEHLKVTLVEAGEHILPALPERISKAAHKELNKIRVNEVTKTASD